MCWDLFTRVFLREIGYLTMAKGRLRKPRLSETIESFLDWTHAVATRKPGSKIRLRFASKYMNISCVLVGDPEDRYLSIEPYVRRVQENYMSGDDVIYILARKAGVPNAKAVAAKIESMTDLALVQESRNEYIVQTDKGPLQAVAIVFRSPQPPGGSPAGGSSR